MADERVLQRLRHERQFKGHDTLEKEVTCGGNSGRIFVPKAWVGRRVRVIRLEPIEDVE